MKNTIILFALFVVILSGCSGSNSASYPATGDTSLYVNGYIYPTSFAEGPLDGTASTTYIVRISVNETDGTTLGAKITNALITVNDDTIPYVSAYGQYSNVLSTTYGAGSLLTITIDHPGSGTITRMINIPSAVVPASYTISPAFSSGSTVAPPYTITPGSAWGNYGCIAALLYDNALTYKGYSYWASISSGSVTFSSQRLSYGGSTGTLAPNVDFVAWSMDKIDYTEFGAYGSTPSRIRVFAPSGHSIAKNF